MPLLGFSAVFAGSVLFYAGFLGIAPTTVLTNIFNGTKMPKRLPVWRTGDGSTNIPYAPGQDLPPWSPPNPGGQNVPPLPPGGNPDLPPFPGGNPDLPAFPAPVV